MELSTAHGLDLAFDALEGRAPFVPELAIVLGSGLGALAECPEARRGVVVPFTDLPGFPEQTVLGHRGQMIFCELEGRKVVLQSGRFHGYEGHPPALIVAPMRLYARLGVRSVLMTNAAGAINPAFSVGDLMVVSDHINLQGSNPLTGPNQGAGSRFPDMGEAYDKVLRRKLHKAGEAVRAELKEGVYLAVMGPSFETPAEIRAYRILGADVVGMSTVPEVIVARHEGMKVACVSCISNMAAGIARRPLSQEEVLEVGAAGADRFESLIRSFLESL